MLRGRMREMVEESNKLFSSFFQYGCGSNELIGLLSKLVGSIHGIHWPLLGILSTVIGKQYATMFANTGDNAINLWEAIIYNIVAFAKSW